MKKTILIIGLTLVLFGCPQIQVKDCGTDLECFAESLTKGEKAKMRFTEPVLLERFLCPCGTETTENTEAEITECNENSCEVKFTNIHSWSFLEGTEKDEQWNQATCDVFREPENVEIDATNCKEIK